jgi:hypothetical protein
MVSRLLYSLFLLSRRPASVHAQNFQKLFIVVLVSLCVRCGFNQEGILIKIAMACLIVSGTTLILGRTGTSSSGSSTTKADMTCVLPDSN